MKYEIMLDKFEGPLDLLYHLIEKEKIDIYDIPIYKITSQYISYINNMKELDLEITSEFLIMASTLIEIKSKMLLPKTNKENTTKDEEELDPREELVKRLIEYKKYKEASIELKNRENTYKKIYYKAKEEIEYIDDNLDFDDVSLKQIVDIYESILENCIDFSEDVDYEEIKRDEITIEESMEKILYILDCEEKVRFQDFFKSKINKAIIVTTFIAILELIKQKRIKINQDKNFSDIFIELKIK